MGLIRQPYTEEKIAGLMLMCEALMCHIHFTAEEHEAQTPSQCSEEVCQRYMEGRRLLYFGSQDDDG